MPQTTETALLPPRAHHVGTHRSLLEAALLLFGGRGYHAVTVREIATAVGIRAPSIYKHIESKEQLLLELLLLGHEEHRSRLRAALITAGTDPITQLQELVRAHVAVHAEYPALARVANREIRSLSDVHRQRVEDIRNDSSQTLTDIIKRGIDLGKFAAEDLWLATAAIGAMGLRVAEWWDDHADYSVDDVADIYATYALRMLQRSS